MNETIVMIAVVASACAGAVIGYYQVRLRELRWREDTLLADKERWESQKAAELLALKAHPDDAQIWLQDENGEGAPYRVIAVGRN